MRLPPLNALRAFEAAARHGGFVGAAEELHVTRGAVSRHVKGLEADLGVALFVRKAQGVRLTAAGARLLPILTEAFGRMSAELTRIRMDARDLRVLCPPATSIRWLLPRMQTFRQAHPDLRLRLTTDFHGEGGFDDSSYDIAFSLEHWPGRPEEVACQPLFPVRLTPACSPTLLERVGPLDGPGDLAGLDLLHETAARLDWTAWVEAHGLASAIDAGTGPVFPNLDMAMRAAIMGLGVVMADLVLCREELESGLLVTPFPDLLCEGTFGDICLLARSDRWHEPAIARFRTWAAGIAMETAPFVPGSTGRGPLASGAGAGRLPGP
jgi:DNA-binding transcriptional LysR family regulator